MLYRKVRPLNLGSNKTLQIFWKFLAVFLHTSVGTPLNKKLKAKAFNNYVKTVLTFRQLTQGTRAA